MKCNIFIIIAYLLFRLNAAQQDAYVAALLGENIEESVESSDDDDSEDENWVPAGGQQRRSRNNEASDNEEVHDFEEAVPEGEMSDNEGENEGDVEEEGGSSDDESENENDDSEAAPEVQQGSYIYIFTVALYD